MGTGSRFPKEIGACPRFLMGTATCFIACSINISISTVTLFCLKQVTVPIPMPIPMPTEWCQALFYFKAVSDGHLSCHCEEPQAKAAISLKASLTLGDCVVNGVAISSQGQRTKMGTGSRFPKEIGACPRFL